MYGVYIIHDKKKVGLAKDIDDRLRQQGYDRFDRGVKIFQENISSLEDARMVEKTVQEALGYTAFENGPDLVDRFLQKKEFVTGNELMTKSYRGNTFGFQIPKEMFSDWIQQFNKITLIDSRFGEMDFSCQECKDWLKANARKSKFAGGNLPTYVYVKAAYEFHKSVGSTPTTNEWSFGKIRKWAHDKKLWGDKVSCIKGQSLKLGEEFGELQHAVLKGKKEEVKDAVGDLIVVLTSIAELNGHSIEDAIQHAWDQIKDRKGKTNDQGDFIKEEL